MDKNLHQALEGVKQLQKTAQRLMNKAMTDEVIRQLTPEQKELIQESKRAMDLEGMTLEEKKSKLDEILRKWQQK